MPLLYEQGCSAYLSASLDCDGFCSSSEACWRLPGKSVAAGVVDNAMPALLEDCGVYEYMSHATHVRAMCRMTVPE